MFFVFLVCCVFAGKFDGSVSVSQSDVTAKRPRFDIGAMMRARKESERLHEKIVVIGFNMFLKNLYEKIMH